MRTWCLFLILFFSATALAELNPEIKIRIEEPAQGDSYSGLSNLRGWAVAPAGITRNFSEIYIDDQFVAYIFVHGQRTDVGNAHPDYPFSDRSGFAMAFNYKNLTPGEHEITVKVVDDNDDYNVASQTFNTERFVVSFISDDSDVDISTSETWTIVDNQTYLITGPTLEGKRWDFQLKWDRASQSFKTERIVPFGSGSGGNSGGSSDAYVCATSTTRNFSSSSTVVTMKNGAELNNYDGRYWPVQNSYLIFRASNGKWYALEEHWDPYNTPSYDVFRIDLISEPQSCFEPDLFEITGIEEGFTWKTYSWSGGSLGTVDRDCGIEVGALVYIFTTSEYEYEVMVDVRTAEVCEA